MRRILGALFLGLITLVTVTAQEPQTGEPEVLTRGPIHEAYATSAAASPQPGPIAPKAPPEAIEELPPEQKPEGEVVFIPGYWSWDEDRSDFIWISGFWRVPPPGRQWVPGNWRQAGTAWQWTPGFWAGTDTQEIEYVPPPPAPLESTPSTPAPGDNYLYAPGNWVYQDTRYIWRPGFWYVYRPDWIYVPAHYCWTPCGYVFVNGYWDYPLRRRGCLFAPVYFTAGIYTRPAFVYRPSFVIYDEALYGCLFVRPGFSAYYFGDYFDVRYRSGGYRSWFDVRIGVGAYDPLWGYYRYHYASTPGWSVGITTLYAGRYNGTIARPPRTFIQQTNVVNNITNNTTVINNTNINVVKNVTLAAPITKVDKTVINLKPVSAAEQTTAAKAAKDVQRASVERGRLETQALAQVKPGAPGQPATPAQPIKVALPQTAVKNPTPPPPPPAASPKAPTPAPKDAPKGSASKDAPAPKDTPKTPAPTPKDAPKTPPPASKETPKTPPSPPKEAPNSPTPAPKETSKGPPPAPKETPKTPAPAPKEAPKSPPPSAPKEAPKSPPPSAPKEAPKSPPPSAPKEAPKSPPPSAPKETPKSPPPPAPKSPSPPTPAPKTPPPPQKGPPPPPPKNKDKDKGGRAAEMSIAPLSSSTPKSMTPSTSLPVPIKAGQPIAPQIQASVLPSGPSKTNAPSQQKQGSQQQAARSIDRTKKANEKNSDRSKQ